MREPGIQIPWSRKANPGPEIPTRALGIAMREPGIATPGQEISTPAPRSRIPSAERLSGNTLQRILRSGQSYCHQNIH